MEKSFKLKEPRVSLVGKKFNKLTVVSLHSYIPSRENKPRKCFWVCNCDCGKKNVIAEDGRLKGNSKKSCGCLRYEILEKMWEGNAKDDSFVNTLIREYRGNARNRRIDYSLSREEFIELIKGNCRYCGIEPLLNKKLCIGKSKYSKKIYLINGIDRVDSSRGYHRDNCVSCCRRCNLAKNDMTVEEFRNWLERIFNNYINKK